MLRKICRIIRVIFNILIHLFFSFHNEKLIIKQGSKSNQSILITKLGSKRIMRFKDLSSGAQSQIDLNKIDYPDVEYIRIMLMCLIYNKYLLNKSNILIIGLGGGILPRSIRKLSLDCLITIIEIDPIVKEMAEKYFYFKEDLKMKVFINDGREYLFNLSNEIQYEIIYIDAYDSINGLPNQMKTKEFFLNLNNHLNEFGGLICINLVCIYQSYLNVLKTIYSVFNLSNIIKYRTNDYLNMIIIISNSSLQLFQKNNSILINQFKNILSIDINQLIYYQDKQYLDNSLSTFIYTDQNNQIQNEQHISFQQFINQF